MLVAGCGYSASPALLPQHLKSVAIPVFENATPQAQLEQQLTDEVVQRFVRDNHLRIVDEKSANAVIRGRITSYKRAPYGFAANATAATTYRATINVQVTFKDLVKNREMWSDDLVKSAIWYAGEVPNSTAARTEEEAIKEALLKIADEILSRSVEGW